MVKNPPTVQQTQVPFLGQEDPLDVGQRALEHLLGGEREGSTNCTLET